MNWSLLSVCLRRIAFWFPILKPCNISYTLPVRRCAPVCRSFWRQVEGYNFLKWSERTEISRVLMGRGLLWADGETHRRQRKVMLPGFGGNYAVLVRWILNGHFSTPVQSIRDHLPASGGGGMFHVIFRSRLLTFESISWQISGQTSLSIRLTKPRCSMLPHGCLVLRWILLEKVCMTCLDTNLTFAHYCVQSGFWLSIWCIGGYKEWLHGSIYGTHVRWIPSFSSRSSSNDVTSFFRRILIDRSDTLGSPSRLAILMQTVLPVWVLQLMSKYSNRRNLVHARHTEKVANDVARQLIDSKLDAALQGKGNKDILSLLGWCSTPLNWHAK